MAGLEARVMEKAQPSNDFVGFNSRPFILLLCTNVRSTSKYMFFYGFLSNFQQNPGNYVPRPGVCFRQANATLPTFRNTFAHRLPETEPDDIVGLHSHTTLLPVPGPTSQKGQAPQTYQLEGKNKKML